MDKSKTLVDKTTEDGHVKVEAKLPSTEGLKEKWTANFPPSNDDINQQLNSAKDTLDQQKKKADLNDQGKTLVSDMKDIIDATKTVVLEKNKDDKLQKLYADSKEAVDKTVPIVQKEGEKLKKGGEKLAKKGEKLASKAADKSEVGIEGQTQQLSADAQELYGYIKNLLWNFVKSEDFRELASDWIGFIQFLTTRKIKEQAKKQEGQGGATENIAKAIDEGLEQTSKPADEDELQKRTEDMFQNLLDRIRNKPEYQDAFRDIFRLMDQLRANFESVATDVKKEVQSAKQEIKKEVKKESEKVSDQVDADPFWRALYDARDIVYSFTGQEDFDKFVDTLNHTWESVRYDTELRSWFYELRSFLELVWDNPDSVTQEQFKTRSRELTQRGRQILQKDKWNEEFNLLVDRFNVLLENIKNDSTTNQFADKLKKFGTDFAFNKQGYPDLYVMEDSVIQIKNLLIPLLKEQLANINIGRIEFSNETYDVKLEDIGFSGSFLPEHIDFSLRNDSHLNTKDSSKDSMRHSLLFQVDKIKPEFRNFKFYYRRKTFPKIEDYGVADLKVVGNGGLIRINWRIDSKAGSKPYASLSQVTVYIDKIDLHIVGEKTKHDILDKMMAPLLQSQLKHRMAQSLEEYLKNKLGEMNTQLNKFLQSSPIDKLQDKANQAMQEGYKQMQQTSSVTAI